MWKCFYTTILTCAATDTVPILGISLTTGSGVKTTFLVVDPKSESPASGEPCSIRRSMAGGLSNDLQQNPYIIMDVDDEQMCLQQLQFYSVSVPKFSVFKFGKYT